MDIPFGISGTAVNQNGGVNGTFEHPAEHGISPDAVVTCEELTILEKVHQMSAKLVTNGTVPLLNGGGELGTVC